MSKRPKNSAVRTGLYVHVPFCISKCSYCDFYSFVSDAPSETERFLESLEVELQRLPKTFQPDTVFFGGGTPTMLNADELEHLTGMVRAHVDLSKVVEYSTEANPGTLTTEKLTVLQEGGVNRISIGVQSFNDRALKLLGRTHSSDEAAKAVAMARAAGIQNIGIDLIQGIPGMSLADVLDDVQKAINLSPDHISYYNLIFEEGTPITADRDWGRVVEVDDDHAADIYVAVKQALESAGYEHYEISNFAKPGRESLHNMLYWRNEEYFGVGPSAHSHWDGARFGNVSDLNEYCDRLACNKDPFDAVEKLDLETKAREALVMGLRMLKGINLSDFEKMTGFSVEKLCGDKITGLISEGLLCRDGGRLHLTEKALFVSNYVFSELV